MLSQALNQSEPRNLFADVKTEYLIISTINNRRKYFVVVAKSQSEAIERFEVKYSGKPIKQIEKLSRI